MHEQLLSGATRDRGKDNNPGRFRDRQVYIGSALDIALARYVPPPAEKVDALMANLEEYANARTTGKYHPMLVRIAIAHYQFEAIHPFLDGNGRIGRLLISLLLSSWGILPEPLLYLSDYFERNKTEYQDRLWRVSRDADWIGWVQFFLKGVREVAHDATKRARTLLSMREQYRQSLQQGKRKASAKALALVDYIFRCPFITAQMAAGELGVTYNAGRKNIDKLIEAGILFEHESRTWNKLYYAKPVLDVLSA